MTDITKTIQPKSSQLNADDMIAGEMTIKITKVSLVAGDQPVAINYEGDNGKPYLPCKSMRRILIMMWGGDSNAYIGRSLKLFRDEKVRFGGVDVGGIRIRQMSDISQSITVALTVSKAVRKPYTISPLVVSNPVTSTQYVAMINEKQVNEINGMLANLPAKLKSIIKRYGSVEEIPLDKYQAVIDWILEPVKE